MDVAKVYLLEKASWSLHVLFTMQAFCDGA